MPVPSGSWHEQADDKSSTRNYCQVKMALPVRRKIWYCSLSRRCCHWNVFSWEEEERDERGKGTEGKTNLSPAGRKRPSKLMTSITMPTITSFETHSRCISPTTTTPCGALARSVLLFMILVSAYNTTLPHLAGGFPGSKLLQGQFSQGVFRVKG